MKNSESRLFLGEKNNRTIFSYLLFDNKQVYRMYVSLVMSITDLIYLVRRAITADIYR